MSEYDLQDDLNTKLKHYFDGKIVRKDLTKRVKEGANVPVYVLEYLLGKYCSQNESPAFNAMSLPSTLITASVCT